MEWRAILTAYRELEVGVGRVMNRLCAPSCSVCRTPCCRIGICREALDSPFLQKVHATPFAFDRKVGFLGPKGCRLSVGRPPVCHSFICHTIKTSQPSDQHRYAIDCLSDLIDFVGTDVCRGRHLVEALTDDDLQHLDPAHFQQRLTIANAAFRILDRYFEANLPLSDMDLQHLRQIRSPAF